MLIIISKTLILRLRALRKRNTHNDIEIETVVNVANS